MPEFLQFLFSGLTVGAIYALVALGFTLIYNASDVQLRAGRVRHARRHGDVLRRRRPACRCRSPRCSRSSWRSRSACCCTASRSSRRAARPPVTLIIITIGASILLRGVAAIVFDKNFHSLPPFSGGEPWIIGGAALLPQSVVVLIGAGADRRWRCGRS